MTSYKFASGIADVADICQIFDCLFQLENYPWVPRYETLRICRLHHGALLLPTCKMEAVVLRVSG